MTIEEAKFILAGYRPNGADAEDPHFQEALALTEKDETLAKWFDQQQAFSAALTEKIREIEVPDHLRSTILTGASVSRKSKTRTISPWPRRLAIAAALMLSAAAVFLWQNRFVESGPANLASYRVDMGNYLSRFFLLDYQSEDLGDVKKWISEKQGFTDYAIPASLANQSSVGCEVITWHDKEVYLICFEVDDEMVHLFAFPNGAGYEDFPSSNTRQWSQTDEWAGVSWAENGHAYYVMTLGDEAFLKETLNAANTASAPAAPLTQEPA